MSIEKQIFKLKQEIEEYNKNYYIENSPSISDFEFDMKLKQLEELEKIYPQYFDKNSPTQVVGSDINKSFKQVAHKYPMLSLSNTYSYEEVEEFYNRVGKALGTPFEVVCELKFDGASISLTYENGVLTRAVTRGNGEFGDDVTPNVCTIEAIPLSLRGNYPAKFEIRGEILMPFDVFDELNSQKSLNGEAPFANPRNAASGALKLLNAEEVANRKLDSYLYAILGDNLPFDNHYENIQQAKKWGFKISNAIKCCKSKDEVLDFISFWDKERRNLPVATDGIVLKVNNIHQQNTLGFTSKSPRWAIAYKYQAEKALTKLNSVSYQVGRTGVVTPIANLQPVILSGTMVKRASLHNADVIEGLDLHIGDMVYVEKGGEIIPKITGIETEFRLCSSPKVLFPNYCPECGSSLVRNEDEAAYYCQNEKSCPPQIKGRLLHFVSRKTMNISGLGEETVSLLFEKNLIKDVADIYSLRTDEMSELEGLGDRSAQNIIQGIELSKQVPFANLLFALGIRHVGEIVAKRIVKVFDSIEKLENASFEELQQVEDIGESIAKSIVDYFQKEDNKVLIERLKKAGLQLSYSYKNEANYNILAGKSIVISGVFSHHTREEYKNIIEQNGGINSSAISKNTAFLLAGEGIGPSKKEKAINLNVKIISEDDFLNIIEEKTS